MDRYHHNIYELDTTPRWVAVFDLQWQVIESQRLEPATDLYGAMTAAIARLAAEGWQIEAEPRFGVHLHSTRCRATAIDAHAARSARYDAAVFQSV
jgi:hypothetical protein